MPEPKSQPRSREIEGVDNMGGHGAPFMPESREGKNMLPPYDRTIPLVPIQRKMTEYVQQLRTDEGPHAAHGFSPKSTWNGDTIIEGPKEKDPAYSPDMPRVKWLHAAHGYALDDKLRGSTPVDPQHQKSVPSSRGRKEEKHA